MTNIKSTSIFLTLLLLSLSLQVNGQSPSSSKVKTDVRLLIDISGSMKKNDPKNLRVPALQLVTNLLPKGADAGVWAFGRYINMLVPLSKVDSNWQIKATKTANKINSRGLYTNIGAVLEKASYGWNAPDSKEKRSFILLTDGMVDISKDPKVNAIERKKILNRILPKLKKAGVSIHTIALSQNADHELLKKLSTETDGWYQAVNNADELQRVFLKIFEQAAARDNLPITDNLFSVDKSIEEMTVLIFRKNSKSHTKLISPSGKVFDKKSSGKTLRWFSTDGYDLVTLQKPETGNWKIDADVDPDNRVMVVSKLGLSIVELPNNLLAGEAISYQLQLLEEGKVIDNTDFLKLVDATLDQNKEGNISRLAMFYDEANLAFKQNFFTDSFTGELKLKLNVSSPTFERVRNHAINIYGSPLITELKMSADNIEPHKVMISIRDDIVKSDSVKINVTISQQDGEKQYLVIEEPTEFIDVSANLDGGEYHISFKVTGKSIMGRKFSVTPKPIVFTANILENSELIEEPKTEEPEAKESEIKEPETKIELPIEVIEKEQEPIEEPIKKEPTPEPEEVVEGEGINWIYVGIGGNFVLGLIGFFVWRLIKKRTSQGTSQVADELGIDDDDDDDDDEEDDDDEKEDKNEDKKNKQ